MARKFLYFIALMIVALLGLMLVLRIWADDLTELAFVPEARFAPQPRLAGNAYERPEMWISRPGLPAGRDPARWLPQGYSALRAASDEAPLDAAVFFVHPTSFLEKQRWNAPLDEAVSRGRAALFVQGMASPFNRSADLWAPRYRQATVGAFLTDGPQAAEAIELAYGDVLQAFDHFLAHVAPDKPVVLAGHSQGAFHLRRLIRDRVAGKPLARRIAVAYVVGWPVSREHDLPAMGLPACTAADQPGCVMSWISFAEPADNAMLLKNFARRPGLDGKPIGASGFVCTNPLTGGGAPGAGAEADLGTLVPDVAAKTGKLVPRMVPARCGNDGILSIGSPPDLGPYVLPGNNYHLYDMVLFWANLRADAARRVAAWRRPE